MHPASVPYTLVGFDRELDWKPLRFVKPIPQHRICGVCGLVCKRTALLPCMHVLCECCFEQCGQDAARVCPLDGRHCQDADADWKGCPTDEMLRMEVTCSNEDSGCGYVFAASEISRHLQETCGHHSVPCPKCLVKVLRNNVCTHLRMGCDPVMAPIASKSEESLICMNKPAHFSSFRPALEEHIREMSAFLSRLLVGSSPPDERMNDIYHKISAFKETLTQELAQGIKSFQPSFREFPENDTQTQGRLQTTVRDIVASNEGMEDWLMTHKEEIGNFTEAIRKISHTVETQLDSGIQQNSERLARVEAAINAATTHAKENNQNTLDSTKRVLQMIQLHTDHCIIFMKGVKSLEEAAVKSGFAYYIHERVYLRGYCMSPGARFEKDGDSARLQVIFILHKGSMDDALTWPLSYKIRLSVIHPLKDEACDIIVAPAPSTVVQKPIDSSNTGVWYGAHFLKLEDLSRDGYVLGDQLRVKWKLLL